MSKRVLIPMPIVDKNGKATTVYRKPLRPVSAGSLPVPEIGRQGTQGVHLDPVELDAMVLGIKSRLGITEDNEEITMRGVRKAYSVLKRLGESAPDELRSFDEETRDANIFFLSNWGYALNTLNMVPLKTDDGELIANFRRARVVIDQVTLLNGSKGDVWGMLSSSATDGLVGKVDADDHDSLRAALLLTWMRPVEMDTFDTYEKFVYERDFPVLEFVKSNYDKVLDRREVIHERGTIDLDVLREIIGFETGSLSKGVL